MNNNTLRLIRLIKVFGLFMNRVTEWSALHFDKLGTRVRFQPKSKLFIELNFFELKYFFARGPYRVPLIF